LEAEVALIFAELGPGYEFIQDNVSIYRAGKVKAWFAKMGIILLKDWPVYSSDLNPIE
jgi:hypothetical protein